MRRAFEIEVGQVWHATAVDADGRLPFREVRKVEQDTGDVLVHHWLSPIQDFPREVWTTPPNLRRWIRRYRARQEV